MRNKKNRIRWRDFLIGVASALELMPPALRAAESPDAAKDSPAAPRHDG